MVPSDDTLLKAWRAGDPSSGERLFARHFESAFLFFVNKVRPPDADALLQETFSGCKKHMKRLGSSASFRTFLLQIARRRLLAYLDRADARNQGMPKSGRLDPSDESPRQLLTSVAEQRLLLKVLRAIPLELQIALELTYWEQLDVHELARVLELPAGAAGSRLRRARALLATKMEELAGATTNMPTTAHNLERWMSSMRTAVQPTASN